MSAFVLALSHLQAPAQPSNPSWSGSWATDDLWSEYPPEPEPEPEPAVVIVPEPEPVTLPDPEPGSVVDLPDDASFGWVVVLGICAAGLMLLTASKLSEGLSRSTDSNTEEAHSDDSETSSSDDERVTETQPVIVRMGDMNEYRSTMPGSRRGLFNGV